MTRSDSFRALGHVLGGRKRETEGLGEREIESEHQSAKQATSQSVSHPGIPLRTQSDSHHREVGRGASFHKRRCSTRRAGWRRGWRCGGEGLVFPFFRCMTLYCYLQLITLK